MRCKSHTARTFDAVKITVPRAEINANKTTERISASAKHQSKTCAPHRQIQLIGSDLHNSFCAFIELSRQSSLVIQVSTCASIRSKGFDMFFSPPTGRPKSRASRQVASQRFCPFRILRKAEFITFCELCRFRNLGLF